MSKLGQDEGVFSKEIGLLTLLLLLRVITSILLTILLTTIAIRARVLVDYRVISMRLDMFFEVLRPLESLATKLASVRFQRNMNTDVGCDVVTLDDSDTTAPPITL